jgi:hypothetical protein
MSKVTVVRTGDGVWHRTDILACQQSSVLEREEQKRVDPAKLGDDRCDVCSW